MEDAPQTGGLTLVEIAILLLFTGIVGGGLYWFFFTGSDDPTTEQFQPHITKYLSVADKIVQRQDGFDMTLASHEGKVLAIDVQQNTVDAIQLMLPDRIRANIPGEVTLLVLVDCEQSKVGTYGASDAYSVFCNLSAFDLKLRKILWQSSASRSPPSRANPIPFMDLVAERPNDDMVEMLTQSVNVN